MIGTGTETQKMIGNKIEASNAVQIMATTKTTVEAVQSASMGSPATKVEETKTAIPTLALALRCRSDSVAWTEKGTEHLLVIATPVATTLLATDPVHETKITIVEMQMAVTLHDLTESPVRGVRVTTGVLGAVAATVKITLVMPVIRSRRADCESGIPSITAPSVSLLEF